MNCAVIGYGSIGQRHQRILSQLGARVAVISKSQSYPLTYATLGSALANETFDYIIIANPTDQHYNTLLQLADYGFTGTVLVEKPLFHWVGKIPDNCFHRAFVGYNLRFHPIIQRIFSRIQKEQTLFAQVYVGQYLPTWRPQRDYRLSYSADKNQGGGVLLDLSHDLDYLLWFFNDWQSVIALGGRYSSLQINSPDMYSLMLTMEKCPSVQIHLNYLDRINRREITIVTENSSIKADLVLQTLQINQEVFQYTVDRDYTYLLQHRAILGNTGDFLCSLPAGYQVLELINAAEQSAQQRKWVEKN